MVPPVRDAGQEVQVWGGSCEGQVGEVLHNYSNLTYLYLGFTVLEGSMVV